MSLQYIYAIQNAVNLFEDYGWSAEAMKWRELEKEMQLLVDTYQCEWKTVVENPELRKRFKHFVNSDEKDSNVKMRQERAQSVPVDWNAQ